MSRLDRLPESLRAMADFIESRDFDTVGLLVCEPNVMLFCKDAVQFGANVAALGDCKKNSDKVDGYVRAEKSFGVCNVKVLAGHEKVCEKVAVGTKTIPAAPALEATPEREETVYEWKCPDSFLGLANARAKAQTA